MCLLLGLNLKLLSIPPRRPRDRHEILVCLTLAFDQNSGRHAILPFTVVTGDLLRVDVMRTGSIKHAADVRVLLLLRRGGVRAMPLLKI